MATAEHEQLLSEIRHLREQIQALESGSRLAAIVENTDDAIIAKSLDGTILSWNGGAERMYGYSSEEIVGKSILTIVPTDHGDEITDICQRIAAGQHIPPFETVRMRKDGTSVSVSLCVSPILDDEGHVTAASVIARVLRQKGESEKRSELSPELERYGSEQARLAEHLKEANLELKHARKHLERSNAELEAFSYSVSHDLRAPLRAVRGFAEILSRRNRSDLDEQSQRYLDNIVEAGAQMDELIEDLLAHARLGRRGVERVVVPLAEVFQRLLRDLQPTIQKNYASVFLAGDLPVVLGDATLLYQVFGNLLINAVTYHREDASSQVHVNWCPSGDRVIVSVRDNGIGIASDYHAKIFELFQRLHPRGRYPGTGIGLGIARKAVDLLDGRIWLESVPGSGAEFFVELPTVSHSADQLEKES